MGAPVGRQPGRPGSSPGTTAGRQRLKAEKDSKRRKGTFVFQRIRKKGLDPPNLLTPAVFSPRVGLALTQLQAGSVPSERSSPGRLSPGPKRRQTHHQATVESCPRRARSNTPARCCECLSFLPETALKEYYELQVPRHHSCCGSQGHLAPGVAVPS